MGTSTWCFFSFGFLAELLDQSPQNLACQEYRKPLFVDMIIRDATPSHARPIEDIHGLLTGTGKGLLSKLRLAHRLLDGSAGRFDNEEALALLREIEQILSEIKRPTGKKHFTPGFRHQLLGEVNELIGRALVIQAEQDKREQVERAKRETTENLMAMFAHQFRGSVGSIMFNTTHQHDKGLYVDAARTMNGLLDIFSVVSASPDKLASSLKEDVGGGGSPAGVLLHALKLALLQLLSSRNRGRMSPHYLAYAKRQGKAPNELRLIEWCRDISWQALEEDLQAEWEQEIGAMIVAGSMENVAEWMATHLLPFRLQGFMENTTHFSEYGPKASLLTVVFTEVLVNAIKHSAPSASDPLLAIWSEKDDQVIFTCTNPSNRDSRNREKSKGSGRGHKFLGLISDHLQGRFEADVTSDQSQVSLIMPANIMKGETA